MCFEAVIKESELSGWGIKTIFLNEESIFGLRRAVR